MSFIRKSETGNRQSAFTLVELLVVIAIIGLLVGITIPLVGKVRKSSQEAATRSLIGQIEAAAQAYYNDFTAYPGPFSHGFMTQSQQQFQPGSDPLYRYDPNNFNVQITDGSVTPGHDGFNNPNIKRLTGTENLVLGLMGGLVTNNSSTNLLYGFKRDDLSLGAIKFNPKRPGRAISYMQATNLSEGRFADDAGVAKDTEVPEFIDSFSNPMPILYLRARKAGEANTGTLNGNNNNVVVDGTGANAQIGQYNLLEIAAYTQSTIGIGRAVPMSEYKNHQGTNAHGLVSIDPTQKLGTKTTASRYPFDAYAYFTDPASNDANLTDPQARYKKHRARKQDSIILISAGIDRIYGTEDDITNFGPVVP